MYFNELFESEDRTLVKHLGQSYETDKKMFTGKFSKEVEATEDDMVIKVTGHTSEALLQAKNSNGSSLAIDAAGFKDGKNPKLIVKKGEKATIEFPIRPQVATWAGNIGRGDMELTNEEFKQLDGSAQIVAKSVHASHYHVMYVGEDESLYGMGWRVQGTSAEEQKLQLIEKPADCKDYKKVTTGKFSRQILTNSGKLFFNGQSKRRQYGNGSMDDHQKHFWEVPDNFYPRATNDKIIDISAGRHNNVIVTQSGKVYAGGEILYRVLEDCRSNTTNSERDPFEIKLPDGFKAI